MMTATILTAIEQGSQAATAVSLLYAATVSVSALTAIMAPTEVRRQAAREVLTLLLRRRDR
ncbi:hypothetical protein Aab01nite_29170 [Paractinoplanes abujensis]|uniref:Uncharacterized protein n=1 Tax=Paractinoplanes abujensis TaxID=882441 RepID=A0A7W7D0V3_9ACTN|nr:hypothetical protein [Actinoplanes abujensis]MBB4698187.1 hypothetical protein [Actinoplanes abujensis]GID19327.1 hypothetical protein Aab01nite_29170 [Actinoplanes abujensis]